jgi:DNA (cytosine-5)-methyltransferase 1
MKKSFTALSFFSGCLGLDLGLEEAGIETLLACEFDRFCQQTIRLNKPQLPVISDILDYDGVSIKKLAGLEDNQRPTVIVGGPPCQAFSTAGKRQAFTDPRGNVFLKYLDLIKELTPDFAVIENVRGLLSASLKHRPLDKRGKDYPDLEEDEFSGSALKHVLDLLESYGYKYSFNLYNTANYGVPQKRERVFLIACLDSHIPPYISPTHSEGGEYGLEKWTTFRSVVKGLKEKDMHSSKFPESRLKYYRMLKDGQYWKDLPVEIQKEALGKSFHSGGGKTGFLRRLAWDAPSPTLVTSPTMPATDLAHPEKDRPLSIEEYKRVQQFPDDWILAGDLTSQYRQVGNAVPVGMGKALGKLLVSLINKDSANSIPSDFPFSRYTNTNEQTWKLDFDKRKSKPDKYQLTLGL